MKKSQLMFLFLLFFSIPANAHLIGGGGLQSGLVHPLFGFDHLLAMVAVGVISTQAGKKGVFLVPVAFVAAMVFGGTIANTGMHLPAVEPAIALSVLILGILVALSQKIPLKCAIACVALFALFHGHAHGEELPAISNAALYVAGFVLSTTALHASGIIIGHFAKKTDFSFKLLRFSGALVGIAGIFFLAAA